MTEKKEPLLKARSLSKRFGTLAALHNISLDIFPGEVIGVTGQSGSGKSTLANLLSGYHSADRGQIYFEGKRFQWPFSLRSQGLEVIHQTPKLSENLDITSSIFLGNELGWSLGNNWFKIPNQLKMDQEATRVLTKLEIQYISLREKVCNLSGEMRQMIAIAKVMTTNPRLIIVDDPARVLSYPYQQILLSLISDWQKQGKAVLFISSNLEHLLSVTDKIIVLRKGYRAAEFTTTDADREEIIAAMVGTTDYQELAPIIWAIESYYRARDQADKIQRSQNFIDRELVDPEAINQTLIDHLTEQITILDSTNLALENAQRRLLNELEKERKHLAREIHDIIIQDLLSTNYQLEELEAHSQTPRLINENLINIRSNLRSLIDELRNICGNLRPPTIDNLGINAAIQSYAQEWSNRTSIQISLNLDYSIDRMQETIELSIYRIVQESLSNILKHANAENVVISLQHCSPRTLMITIEDDGKGIAEDLDLPQMAKEGHYGLLGISERVALLGGQLRFQNKPEGGLIILAEIPHT